MTFETMNVHEAVTVHHGERDFRRRGLNALVRGRVRGPAVLDMRCLGGHLAVALAGDGHAVTALDAYAPAVDLTNERARERGLAPIAMHWDLTGLLPRVGRERFDTVVCLDVLNHVRDDRETLGEIAQVLRPGGQLILAVPAVHRLLGARDRRLGHLRRYTRRELGVLLEDHGLAVESIRHWNGLGLPFQFVWESVLRRELKDGGRYGPPSALGDLFRRVLSAWYLQVENRVAFPLGLTLFAVARRLR